MNKNKFFNKKKNLMKKRPLFYVIVWFSLDS